MSLVNIENFYWGLSLVESSNIEDNQFETLTNMFYNKDKRIQTRRGIANFGNAIGSEPITSYFFFQRDDTWARMALCTAWEVMYEYNEWTSDWDSIKTWLTEFETDGTTRTRWSFAVYKNVVYMCNWIDDYASYNWTTYTVYASMPNVRYLKFMQERIFGAWDDSNPSTLYYTDALPTDWTVLNANLVVVGWDELGRINWLLDLWQVILAFKSKKIYSINVATPSATQIDSQNGWYSHRTFKSVENAILYYNDTWVDRVKARSWVSWASALASEPLTADLRSLTEKITPNSYNYSIWEYISPLNNYYFTFDATDDRIPETTLVYSTLTWAWSKYDLPAINDYGYYIDSDWEYHYLAASANWGQMYEIESGFQDFWLAIPSEIKTKKWDFWDSTMWKTFDSVDVIWLKNLWSTITVEVLIDWEVASSSTIDDTFTTWASSSLTIWNTPIWVKTIGWWVGTWEDIDLFQYLIRIPMVYSWPNIQVRMYSEDNPNVWTLDKIRINYQNESLDIFPEANIW